MALPGGDPEYASNVLFVGVNDIGLSNPGNLKFGIAHVQNLTNCDI